MGTCNFKLCNKKECGLETTAGSSKCDLHHKKEFNGNSDVYLIKNYIKLSLRNRDYVDLSGLKFIDFIFDSELLGSNRELHFELSYFKNCKFTNLKINKNIFFSIAVFIDTYFNQVEFKCNHIAFNDSRFEGDYCPFSNCYFQAKEEISFSATEFKINVIPFFDTQLVSPKVDFSRCYFESNRLSIRLAPHPVLHPEIEIAPRIFGDRSLVISSNDISFDRLNYSNNFELIQFLKEKDHYSELELTLINFSSMNSAVFINVNLKETYFLYSVIDSIRFIKTTWELDNKRKIIYDEIKPFEDKDITLHLRDLIELYIQLKKNYEQNHNYIDAGDWHYREMELRKKEAKQEEKQFYNFGLWVYKLISEYGENYKRPFWIIVILASLFPIVYMVIGFQDSNGELYYRFSLEFFTVDGFLTALSDYGKNLLFSLRTMAFMTGKELQGQNIYFKTVHFIQSFITVILVPLFLLALRRKFKR